MNNNILKQTKLLILISCVGLLSLSMQSRWHGYHLHKNGVLRSHTNITGFTLVLIHPSHEQYFGTSVSANMRLLLSDTSYDIHANRADTAIPNNKQINLFQNSIYYSTKSEKDQTVTQNSWSTSLLKTNRSYLLVLPETRRYARQPAIYFKVDAQHQLQAITRTWLYLKLSS